MRQITFAIACERFLLQGRNDIELIEEYYFSWKKNARFYDKVVGETFDAIPKNVYAQKSSHPKRSVDQRKQTNLARYGNTCSAQGEKQKEKAKETFKAKYGTEHPWQDLEVRDKIKATMLSKYGVENISSLEETKQKVKETNLLKFGVAYPSQNPEIKKATKRTNNLVRGCEYPMQDALVKAKTKATMMSKYGIGSPFQLEGVSDKAKKTCVEKYGTEFYTQSKKRVIEDTGEYLLDWWNALPQPKMPYSYMFSYYKANNHKAFTSGLLKEIQTAYLSRKTNLEINRCQPSDH